jgi:hypothetical protein
MGYRSTSAGMVNDVPYSTYSYRAKQTLLELSRLTGDDSHLVLLRRNCKDEYIIMGCEQQRVPVQTYRRGLRNHLVLLIPDYLSNIVTKRACPFRPTLQALSTIDLSTRHRRPR